MNNVLTKKNVLKISISYLLFLLVSIVFAWVVSCPMGRLCNNTISSLLGNLIVAFSPLLLVSPFSLITYKMRDEVFEYWRNFSIWSIPALVLVTFLLSGGGGGGIGIGGAVGGWFAMTLIGTLIVIYLVTSVILIVKKHSELKGKK